MNYYKNVGMKDPLKELSFFISPGLKYLGMNLWICESKTKLLFSLSLIGYTVIQVKKCTHRYCIYNTNTKRERERERETERERVSNPL